MKLLFLALFAIIATGECLTCKPKSTWKNYCNTCRCSASGKMAQCTRMGCDYDVWNMDGTRKPVIDKSQQICEPRTTFKEYCNTCKCSSDGTIKDCTFMACEPGVWNKDGTRKFKISNKFEDSGLLCKPHTLTNDYCNTCECSADGKTIRCTGMDCPPNIWNQDGTLKDGVQEIRRH